MESTILFSKTVYQDEEEFAVAKKYFPVTEHLCACNNTTVIGRYSCLPRYKILAENLAYHGSTLINSFDQHSWITNFDYYEVLKDYTFETWDARSYPYANYDGPVVVKGKTNSKKHYWDTMMFANNRREAIEVSTRLHQDDLIGRQELIYRKYVPLVAFEVGLNGLSFTNEWRCFFLGNKLVAHGYYWTEADDVETPRLSEEGLQFVMKVAQIASQYTNFFVLDIGEKADGGWILVEVNEGQMSGLSMIDHDVFYGSLAGTLLAFQPNA